MGRIAHISDLHFPRTQPGITDALCKAVREANPNLTVISGDLTQRARESQFQLAAEFLRKLPQPQLVVPGNHDVPLYDLFRRFFRPLERFGRLITTDLTPRHADDSLLVVGANSTRAFTLDPRGFWKNGSLSDEQLETISAAFVSTPPEVLRVLVVHHPLINPHDESLRDTLMGRERILRALERARVDVVLSGHLHKAYGRHATCGAEAVRGILCIQSGTSCSTRYRDEMNAFNLIDWNDPDLTVRTMRFADSGFVQESQSVYRLR